MNLGSYVLLKNMHCCVIVMGSQCSQLVRVHIIAVQQRGQQAADGLNYTPPDSPEIRFVRSRQDSVETHWNQQIPEMYSYYAAPTIQLHNKHCGRSLISPLHKRWPTSPVTCLS